MMYRILEKDSEEDLSHKSQHPRQCFHKTRIIQFLRKERREILIRVRGSHYVSI